MMRGGKVYIWQLAGWPELRFDSARLAMELASLHEARGRLSARLESLGLAARDEVTLACLTEDALRTSEIEGERLDETAVRSSFARRLGIEIERPRAASRSIDGLVEVLLDALWKCREPLTDERLFAWHASLFPTGFSGMARIEIGCWRTARTGPMRVVSGPHGRQRVHFEAPPPERLGADMRAFLEWFDGGVALDPVVRSGLAHLWFVTLHPFADGNGRIARAIGDLALARADRDLGRFYSVSSQIAAERADYYDMLERAQKGTLDVSDWLAWYVGCVMRALERGSVSARGVADRAGFWSRHAGVPMNERQSKVLRRFLLDFEGNLTAMKWAKLAKCSPDTALRDLNDLIAKGVLRKSVKGGRSTSYELHP
jgi:Fic family protein